LTRFLACAVALAFASSPVLAEGQLTIKVGYSPGGSYDVSARLVADFIGKYLPGTPDVVVENDPGAGSLKLAKSFMASGNPDGSEIATIGSTLALMPIFEPESTDFDPTQVHYLASLANQASFCYALKSSGIATLDDLLSKDLKVGATGKASTTYTYPAAIKNAFGAKFEIVVGFEGGAEIDLAMERGDIQVRCGTGKDDLTSDGLIDRVNVLAELSPVARNEIEGVESLIGRATDPKVHDALALIFGSTAIHHPFIAPPGTPEETVATLRAAFAALAADADFQAEAERRGVDPEFTSGEAVEAKIADLLATEPEIATLARDLVQ
jgi:tripartite-type tricarboxylate transporter receptor subunit TctC